MEEYGSVFARHRCPRSVICDHLSISPFFRLIALAPREFTFVWPNSGFESPRIPSASLDRAPHLFCLKTRSLIPISRPSGTLWDALFTPQFRCRSIYYRFLWRLPPHLPRVRPLPPFIPFFYSPPSTHSTPPPCSYSFHIVPICDESRTPHTPKSTATTGLHFGVTARP
ncbi:hypothetical protein C8J57DRAFT_1374134 [Mycena rebaudengoi]|nr:hypothetical protein C8J57DRAFT_1374134 [Mycena rebaudengoi]